MNDAAARVRLRERSEPFYDPAALADEMLRCLQAMEETSDTPPAHPGYRRRTGLLCAPEFRGVASTGRVEDTITEWIAEFFPNAATQVTDLVPGARPDIVFSFDRDAYGEDILAIVEAKPVWQRWIATGERAYSGVASDEHGRSTGNYAKKNLWQVVGDRDKLLRIYSDPRDRHILLALVFQRPGELDDDLIGLMGSSWSCKSHHVVDQCNPPGDNIGMTGMVFWPTHPSPRASARPNPAPPASP